VDELDHVGQGAAAEAAIVVEELDHAHIAVRIACRVGERRAEDRLCVIADDLLLLFGLIRRLTLIKLGRHLDQDLGILDEVVADDVGDSLLIEGGHVHNPWCELPDESDGCRRDKCSYNGSHQGGGKACLEVHARGSPGG
jgi:hypothetical protein